MEGKIPSITGLATISALTAVENKSPSISNLVEKSDYDTTQPANIGPQDVPRTSRSNVPRTSPKDPI